MSRQVRAILTPITQDENNVPMENNEMWDEPVIMNPNGSSVGSVVENGNHFPASGTVALHEASPAVSVNAGPPLGNVSVSSI